MTQVLQDVDTAVSVCFVVKIDDANLGAFSSCDGLGCEVVLEAREEGGNNVHLWQLPEPAEVQQHQAHARRSARRRRRSPRGSRRWPPATSARPR